MSKKNPTLAESLKAAYRKVALKESFGKSLGIISAGPIAAEEAVRVPKDLSPEYYAERMRVLDNVAGLILDLETRLKGESQEDATWQAYKNEEALINSIKAAIDGAEYKK